MSPWSEKQKNFNFHELIVKFGMRIEFIGSDNKFKHSLSNLIEVWKKHEIIEFMHNLFIFLDFLTILIIVLSISSYTAIKINLILFFCPWTHSALRLVYFFFVSFFLSDQKFKPLVSVTNVIQKNCCLFTHAKKITKLAWHLRTIVESA